MEKGRLGIGILFSLLFSVFFTTCLVPFGDIDPKNIININKSTTIDITTRDPTPGEEGPLANPLLKSALLIIRNETPDADIIKVTANTKTLFDEGSDPIFRNGNEKSVWLDPGDYSFDITLHDGTNPIDPPLYTPNRVIAGGGKVYYLFVYQNLLGDYKIWDGTEPRPAELSSYQFGGYISVYNAASAFISSIEITPPAGLPAIDKSELPIAPHQSYTSEALPLYAGTPPLPLPTAAVYKLEVNGSWHVQVKVVEKQVSVIYYNNTIIYPDRPGSGPLGEASGDVDNYGYLLINNNSVDRAISNIAIDGIKLDRAIYPAGGGNKGFLVIALDPKTYKVELYEGAAVTKSVSGVFVQSKEYFIINFPYDGADSSSTTSGATIPDGMGSLVIQNKGPTNIISAFRVSKAGTAEPDLPPAVELSINPDNYREMVLTPGSYDIRLKVLGADNFGSNPFENFEVYAGKTTTITYTDSQEDDRPRLGYSGTIRVRNNSTHTVTELEIFNPLYPNPAELHKNVSIGPSSSVTYIVKYGSYLARATTNETGIAYIEQIITLSQSNPIVDFIIDENSNKVVDDRFSGGDADKGGLRIINAYSGGLPFKMFKIKLYECHLDPDDNTKHYYDFEDHPLANHLAEPFEYEDFTPNYVAKGNPAPDFMNLPEGYYYIRIVAGSYTWNNYDPSPILVGGIPLNEEQITYRVGEVFIAAQTKKVVNFNPYNSAINDKDMPTGFVTVKFAHAGASSGTSGNIIRTQFVDNKHVGAKGGTGRDGSNESTVTDSLSDYIDFPNPTHVDPDPDGNYLVLEDNTVISPQTGQHTYYLAPAIYGMRVWDAATPASKWYGVNDTRYLVLDLRSMAGKTVYVIWIFPLSLNITSNIDYGLIDQTDLTRYIEAPVHDKYPQMSLDNDTYYLDYPRQYTATNAITWRKSTNSGLTWTGPIPSSEKFVDGNYYEATVKITPISEDFTVTGLTANKFSYTGYNKLKYKQATILGAETSQISNPKGTTSPLSITIRFAKTQYPGATIDQTDLTTYIKVPANGASPQMLLDDAHYNTAFPTQYTGAIAWRERNAAGNTSWKEISGSDTFVGGKYYEAILTVIPDTPNFKLQGLGTQAFSFNPPKLNPSNTVIATGTDSSKIAYNGYSNANNEKVTLRFGQTPSSGAPISDTNLSGYITAPVGGATPETFLSSTIHPGASGPIQYAAKITWRGKSTSGGLTWSDVPDTFQTGYYYEATVELRPVSGFTVSGVAPNAFTYSGCATPPLNGFITSTNIGTGVGTGAQSSMISYPGGSSNYNTTITIRFAAAAAP